MPDSEKAGGKNVLGRTPENRGWPTQVALQPWQEKGGLLTGKLDLWGYGLGTPGMRGKGPSRKVVIKTAKEWDSGMENCYFFIISHVVVFDILNQYIRYLETDKI